MVQFLLLFVSLKAETAESNLLGGVHFHDYRTNLSVINEYAVWTSRSADNFPFGSWMNNSRSFSLRLWDFTCLRNKYKRPLINSTFGLRDVCCQNASRPVGTGSIKSWNCTHRPGRWLGWQQWMVDSETCFLFSSVRLSGRYLASLLLISGMHMFACSHRIIFSIC